MFAYTCLIAAACFSLAGMPVLPVLFIAIAGGCFWIDRNDAIDQAKHEAHMAAFRAAATARKLSGK